MASASSSSYNSIKIVVVAHEGIERKLALCTDLPPQEMNAILKAQFSLNRDVSRARSWLANYSAPI
jgi:hypothetical protein